MNQIFFISNYSANVCAIAHFVVALLFLFLGVFVFLQDKRSIINTSYFFICISGFLWLLIDSFAISATNQMTAYFWAKAVYVGISLIPPSMYLFSVSWLNILKNKKRQTILIYFIALVFISLFLLTDNFVIGVTRYSFGYFSRLSTLSLIYLLFFFGVSCAFFWNLFQGYQKETSSIKKTHIKRILIAFAIGFSIGATEFLPTYGIAFYPIGFIAVLVLVSAIAYAIIRYKFLDIETVIHKTLIWLVASSIVFVPIILFSYWLYPWYMQAPPLNVAFVCGLIFYLLTLYLKFIQPKVDHFFQRRKYDLQKASEEFTSDLIHLKNPAQLIAKIQKTIKDTLYAQEVSVQTSFVSKDAFLNWLAKSDMIVYKDIIDNHVA